MYLKEREKRRKESIHTFVQEFFLLLLVRTKQQQQRRQSHWFHSFSCMAGRALTAPPRTCLSASEAYGSSTASETASASSSSSPNRPPRSLFFLCVRQRQLVGDTVDVVSGAPFESKISSSPSVKILVVAVVVNLSKVFLLFMKAASVE